MMIFPSVILVLLIQVFSVYGLTSLGCWKDKPQRALENRVGDVSSVQECVTKCKGRYLYAAVQHGKLCFCGSSYRDYGRSDNCNMRCNSGRNYCGGVWAMNVYRTRSFDGSEGNRNYLGCWKDKRERALENRVGDVRSVEQCVRKCQQGNYPYAAVEYGKQCFCGSSSYSVYGNSRSCNMRCKSGGKYCGGFWAMNVYMTEAARNDGNF